MDRTELLFFVGLHQPCDAQHFDRAFISVNRLKTRKAPLVVGEWILDSGGFSFERNKNAPTVKLLASRVACGRRLAAMNEALMAVVYEVQNPLAVAQSRASGILGYLRANEHEKRLLIYEAQADMQRALEKLERVVSK
jgi:hypothetical protein